MLDKQHIDPMLHEIFADRDLTVGNSLPARKEGKGASFKTKYPAFK